MMTLHELTNQCAALICDAVECDGVWQLTATPEAVRPLLEALQPLFPYPEDLTCVDEGESLRLLYRMLNLDSGQPLHLHVRVPRCGACVPTASDLWRGYEWQEREVFDLFGVSFSGHPDLRRIVTWEGLQGHPLLKDFLIDNDDSSWQIPEQTDQAIVDLLAQAD